MKRSLLEAQETCTVGPLRRVRVRDFSSFINQDKEHLHANHLKNTRLHCTYMYTVYAGKSFTIGMFYPECLFPLDVVQYKIQKVRFGYRVMDVNISCC